MKAVIKNLKLEEFRLHEGKDFLRVECQGAVKDSYTWRDKDLGIRHLAADGGRKSCKDQTQRESWVQETGSISRTRDEQGSESFQDLTWEQKEKKSRQAKS